MKNGKVGGHRDTLILYYNKKNTTHNRYNTITIKNTTTKQSIQSSSLLSTITDPA